ncbi:MAG TPA: phosphotriesterase-related protein [Terriglobia bacterium]|nr:phosphotriesterase-related protein [Terriglobia bacterium]
MTETKERYVTARHLIPRGHIQTVLGPVAPEALGATYSHEHLIIRGGLGLVREPGFKLPSVEKMLLELEDFKRAGGKALVDMMPLDTCRQPIDLVAISQKAGVHVIAATGFHKEMYYDDEHWIHTYSAEQLAHWVSLELMEGMDHRSYNGPMVERLTAKAGVMKVATEYNYATKTQRKLIEALGIAHVETGFPVSTHTENGTLALEQIRWLSAAGVPASAVLVGHLDRLPDLAYHKEVGGTGSYVIYDGPSRAKYGPDSQVVELIKGMLSAGYGKQILLGSDMARASYLRAYGGGPGLDYILSRFLPRLREEGITQEVIEDIMICNPARAFGRRAIPGERSTQPE